MQERDLCLVCNRSKETCFCGFVKPFQTRTRFVLLMHSKEFKRQTTGTGRLTKLSLPNSEIIMGVDFKNNTRLNTLLADPIYYPVILFPGFESINLSESDALIVPQGKTLLVLVIDGTWRLAKKIMWINEHLLQLPKISFTPENLSRFAIKRQPFDYCVSTIEAVHHLLNVLDKRGFEDLQGAHNALIQTIDDLVAFQKKYIGTAAPRHKIKKRPLQ